MTKALHAFLILLLISGLSACAQHSSTPQRQHYVLASPVYNSAPEAATETVGEQVIGVQTVQLAPFLNQTAIVLQLDNNRLHLAKQHLWAEQPDLAITRVLQGELDRLLPQYRVDSGSNGRRDDWQLEMHTRIDQFQGTEAGTALLSGYWELLQEDKVVSRQHFNLTETLPSPGYPALVTSLRALLTTLATQQAELIAQQ